jgi:hypothetical protein
MNPLRLHPTILKSLLAVSGALCMAAATAAPVTFNTDPFAGSTALTTPGRQVFAGNQQNLSSFDVGSDQFVFDASIFGLGGGLSFLNAVAADIPVEGADVIVLQDSDNDANPATSFNAGTAANLIAARVGTDRSGFFVYFNSVLNVNRLVYSTNLNDPNADLSVLARINNPTGPDAINALPSFGSTNFASTVPEPSSALLMGASFLSLLAIGRRRRSV